MTAPSTIVNHKTSPMEKCGLVCHLFLLPIGLIYVLWVLVPEELLEESWNIHYYPPKEWAVHIPLSAVLYFFAAPILYAAMNSFTVPKLTSMDTIRDDYSRKPTSTKDTNKLASAPSTMEEKSTLPEICDLDPASLVWYNNNKHRRTN